MPVIEIIKAVILGIIEGITEWLPISSTGHMLLVDEFLRLEVSSAFRELFLVVVQLGAILAVVAMYIKRLWPVTLSGKPAVRRDVLSLWGKIIVACVPAGVIGVLFDDQITELFFNYRTVAAALIFYGVLFIVIEKIRAGKRPELDSVSQIDYKTAIIIGAFQMLSLIPGTSRSGATIIGAMLLGASRTVAAEFTFFLAIPVMLGASLLKLLKFGFAFSGAEAVMLLAGAGAAFLVSMLAIRFLLGYLRRRDFSAFGWYRIALGVLVLAFFALHSTFS